MFVADIRDVHSQPGPNLLDVEQIPAVLGNQRVHQLDFRAQVQQTLRQVRTNETQPTCDQNTSALKSLLKISHER